MSKSTENSNKLLIDIVLFVKNDNNFEKLVDMVQLNYVPKKGSYYIPVGSKEVYKIVDIIHLDIQTNLILEVTEDSEKYKSIIPNLYS